MVKKIVTTTRIIIITVEIIIIIIIIITTIAIIIIIVSRGHEVPVRIRQGIAVPHGQVRVFSLGLQP